MLLDIFVHTSLIWHECGKMEIFNRVSSWFADKIKYNFYQNTGAPGILGVRHPSRQAVARWRCHVRKRQGGWGGKGNFHVQGDWVQGKRKVLLPAGTHQERYKRRRLLVFVICLFSVNLNKLFCLSL